MFNKSGSQAKPSPLTDNRDNRYGIPTHNKSASTTPASTDSRTPASLVSSPEPAPATTPAPATSTATPAADNETGSRLVVGPNVKLKGAEINDCDTLVVEGRVEATMDSRVLRISEQGAFSGKVGIDIAEIRGRFDGELTARSQLIIHATGRVSGTIRYGKLLIEEGGELSGEVRSLSSERETASDFGKRRDTVDLSSMPSLNSSAA